MVHFSIYLGRLYRMPEMLVAFLQSKLWFIIMGIRESLERQNNTQQLLLPSTPTSLQPDFRSLCTLLENMSFGKASTNLHKAGLHIFLIFLFLSDKQKIVGRIFQSLLKSVVLVVWKAH